MRKVWTFFKNLFFGRSRTFRKKDGKLYQAKCGHQTKLTDTIEVYGHLVEVLLELNGDQAVYCLDCLSKMVIRCTWCGEPIFPGNPITLYSTSNKTFKPPDYAIHYWDGICKSFVGCLRWNCAESGADRAGFWVPPGVVKRVASPLELAAGLNAVVMVDDLSQQNEKPTCIPIEKLEE